MPDAAQINALMGCDWPGNVRELRNLAERYVLLGSQFDWSLDKMLSGPAIQSANSLSEQVECFERGVIEQALAGSRGSIKDTMALLALPRKTLYDKMRKYSLDKADYK
jgi:two-component system C4-dicarboxylate transport response regulator DctD